MRKLRPFLTITSVLILGSTSLTAGVNVVRISDGCDCCSGHVGDVNGSGQDVPTIGDVTMLIDYLFITGSSLGLPECIPLE